MQKRAWCTAAGFYIKDLNTRDNWADSAVTTKHLFMFYKCAKRFKHIVLLSLSLSHTHTHSELTKQKIHMFLIRINIY